MNEEKLREILSEDNDGEWEGDNAYQGLQIIAKYSPNELITGASHDIIYSIAIEKIIELGLTEEDARELRRLNWMKECDCLACFV
jgi:hypothetical protein